MFPRGGWAKAGRGGARGGERRARRGWGRAGAGPDWQPALRLSRRAFAAGLRSLGQDPGVGQPRAAARRGPPRPVPALGPAPGGARRELAHAFGEGPAPGNPLRAALARSPGPAAPAQGGAAGANRAIPGEEPCPWGERGRKSGGKMELLWLPALFLLVGPPKSSASERCDDWGLDTMRQTQVYEGEPAYIQCPLFEHFLKFNYSTAHSAGLTLIWYWIGQDQDLEEPINFRLPDNRISKEKDLVWFRPALLNDTGNYTCMLRNTTYCSKVAFPLEVIQKNDCFQSAMKMPMEYLYLEHTLQVVKCPNIEGFFPSSVKPKVTWYMYCRRVNNFDKVEVNGTELIFTYVLTVNAANYTCVVTYPENGRTFNLTRTVEVRVVASPLHATRPEIFSPNDNIIYDKEPGEDLDLPCKVSFSFLKDSKNEIWWTIDGRKPDDSMNITINQSETVSVIGNKMITRILSIKKVTSDDLKRNYTCHARNAKGESVKQAIVKQIVVPPRYTVELACGFAVTIVLIIILIVVYHVYWLEMVLFYRAHFGTDETILDGKEYDIYVSYARNAEEEEFVLLTLRGVLENEFGYKLCIFDRDSLPGGIVTDETLSFIQKSRRLLVVLSPNYILQGTQSLLELKAGLESMASRGSIHVILVQYKAVKESKVKELKRAQTALTVIKWKGDQSRYPQGRFWKQLQMAMPVKKRPARSSSQEHGLSYSSLRNV
ncbi:interleukin-1 receptor accessory protein isoform X2 [Sarcophilus harrisii]|uniref:Interleukin-1 receptor accessory protein n=1 Tax=Sarcophilus harrisii TaxID=9305 RepID=A0A7N4NVH9_SARHA|nr:interleukin-1 receptor accessory protein isoform X2 [Sarcophilus harrisii]